MGGWKKSFQTVFADVDLLGGMEKELSDSFSDLDLLGGSSICPVHTGFSSEKLGILAGFHPKNQDSRLDFQSKC
ncbi:hypothetical protein [Bacteroides sp.]|uniref:hypothetical protein n=1 Tax=Bacteroides sp. TaxID=29523 RepID=UPI003AAA93FB